jgi:molybdenum cofactor biosynthesis protein B
LKAVVLTVSDRAAAGRLADESGPAVRELLAAAGFEVTKIGVLPDEAQGIAEFLVQGSREHDLVVTTGGTGLGPRDVTPEATRGILEYEVPGLGELMRSAGFAKTPLAALSRSLAGVRGKTLIVNLPGSVKGATESLEAVLPVLGHAIRLLRGDTDHR